MSAARRAECEVAFDGADITSSIRPYLLSLTYTDNEEDETDDLQIKLADRENLWREHWLTNAVDAAASGSGAAEAAQYTVTASSGLNVRAGQGTNQTILGVLSYGAVVDVYSVSSSSWAEIKYNGATAYVSAAYLSATGETKTSGSVGLTVEAVIVAKERDGEGKDRTLSCGSFELDSVTAEGPPSTVTIKCTSLPYRATIRQTKRSRAWESYYLSGIAGEMAAGAGMTLMYLSDTDPFYNRTEQITQSDIDFLSTLCRNAGISLKAAGKILVLFDQAAYEAKDAALAITRGDGTYEKYRLETGECDTQYAVCRVTYTNPLTGATISGECYAEDYDASDESNQTLEINAQVSSIAEAQTLAAKMLRLKNKYERSAEFTLPGDPYLVAGAAATLSGFGAWSGKYIIKSAKHTVSGSGYTTTVTLRSAPEGC
ncbi:MAG: SH3 domain-containing protein [Oscillospiraceae bacterium]|nr:SH3 domain-containing protein [Oscillospiraceae bacterium]